MLASRPSLADLAGQQWDLIVVGGGITGAGVLLEAARQGRKSGGWSASGAIACPTQRTEQPRRSRT